MNIRPVRELDPITEFPGLIWPPTETLLMEAAMVLWEDFLRIYDDAEDEATEPFRLLWRVVGTVEMRHQIMALAPALHLGWHVHERAARGALKAPFDWDFTPWFIRNCAEVLFGAITTKPNWLDLCRAARGEG